MVNLRELQRLRANGGGLPDPERVEEGIKSELAIARGMVDTLTGEGIGRSCVVEAIRAAPQRPPWVREYPVFTEAVEEDPRRALPDWPAREDLSGADCGFRWSLENPIRRWETSRWRVSWLEETEEVYAIECLDRRPDSTLGRVWILGKLPAFESFLQALEELERFAMDERNSLIAAADAVARAERGEAPEPPD